MYGVYTSKFDSSFISHFPKALTTLNINMSCNTYERKNDVGFLLYEYDLVGYKIDSIEMDIKHK